MRLRHIGLTGNLPTGRQGKEEGKHALRLGSCPTNIPPFDGCHKVTKALRGMRLRRIGLTGK